MSDRNASFTLDDSSAVLLAGAQAEAETPARGPGISRISESAQKADAAVKAVRTVAELLTPIVQQFHALGSGKNMLTTGQMADVQDAGLEVKNVALSLEHLQIAVEEAKHDCDQLVTENARLRKSEAELRKRLRNVRQNLCHIMETLHITEEDSKDESSPGASRD